MNGKSIPLIVLWPAGIPTARKNAPVRVPGHLIDLMPTCVDLAKARYPVTFNGHRIHPMEGISLVPAFTGQPIIWPQPLLWEHEGNRAVRDGKWKLVSAYASGANEWELYILDAARTEMNKLVAAARGKAAQLAAQWETWAKRVGVQPWRSKSLVSGGKDTGAEAKPGD